MDQPASNVSIIIMRGMPIQNHALLMYVRCKIVTNARLTLLNVKSAKMEPFYFWEMEVVWLLQFRIVKCLVISQELLNVLIVLLAML